MEKKKKEIKMKGIRFEEFVEEMGLDPLQLFEITKKLLNEFKAGYEAEKVDWKDIVNLLSPRLTEKEKNFLIGAGLLQVSDFTMRVLKDAKESGFAGTENINIKDVTKANEEE